MVFHASTKCYLCLSTSCLLCRLVPFCSCFLAFCSAFISFAPFSFVITFFPCFLSFFVPFSFVLLLVSLSILVLFPFALFCFFSPSFCCFFPPLSVRSFFPSVCFFRSFGSFFSSVSLALLLPPLLFGLFFSSWNTSAGRKFALVEGVNHDLVCAGSNYHVHFAWQVWHGQYSPGFKFNKLKSFARVKIDRTHVDLKDSRGKGFALRRLNKHNFCPQGTGQSWMSACIAEPGLDPRAFGLWAQHASHCATPLSKNFKESLRNVFFLFYVAFSCLFCFRLFQEVSGWSRVWRSVLLRPCLSKSFFRWWLP